MLVNNRLCRNVYRKQLNDGRGGCRHVVDLNHQLKRFLQRLRSRRRTHKEHVDRWTCLQPPRPSVNDGRGGCRHVFRSSCSSEFHADAWDVAEIASTDHRRWWRRVERWLQRNIAAPRRVVRANQQLRRVSTSGLVFLLPVVYQLADAGVDVCGVDVQGNTALHCAALHCAALCGAGPRMAGATYLLKHGLFK